MTDKNYYYKKELKEKIKEALNELHPRKSLGEVIQQDCPVCGETDSFAYFPEIKYGRCSERMCEVGLEYYLKLMANREKDYEEIKTKIEALLKD